MYIHKKTATQDFYYITNKNESREVQFEGLFKIKGKVPQIWNPINGEILSLKTYSVDGEVTKIPLTLNPKQSFFIVFSEKSQSDLISAKKAVDKVVDELVLKPFNGKITFVDEPEIKPVLFNNFQSLTKSSNPEIKYYVGLAKYDFEVEISKDFIKAGQRNYLKLGKFGSTAKIEINGKFVTIVWEQSSEIDITDFIKQGKNTFIISTTNPWRNRLIGDLIYPENKKERWFSSNLKDNGGKVLIDKNSFLLILGLGSDISIISKELPVLNSNK